MVGELYGAVATIVVALIGMGTAWILRRDRTQPPPQTPAVLPGPPVLPLPDDAGRIADLKERITDLLDRCDDLETERDRERERADREHARADRLENQRNTARDQLRAAGIEIMYIQDGHGRNAPLPDN